MIHVWASMAFAVSMAVASQPVRVQFVRSMPSREVMVCLDGHAVKSSSAGKLGFRDAKSTWASICGNVRAPVAMGQMFRVRALRTSLVGGNVAKAGNIVARYFKSAQTPDQCAGLQLAVWEAIEDGGQHAGFAQGSFQARASAKVIAFAEQYYEAIELPGEALFLETGQDGGQDQILPIN